MRSLSEALGILHSQIDQAATQTLLDAGALGVKTAQNTTLFRNHGPLRDATEFHPTSETTGFVLADKHYAQFLEFGNNVDGDYIYPKNSRFLHFFVHGQEVFARKVRAHGPLPFMQNAQDVVENSIESIFQHNIDKFVKGST